MTLMLVMICTAVTIASFFAVRAAAFFIYKNKFSIEINKRVLSVDEQNFLKCLERALGDEYYIMPRLRLLDLGHFSASTNVVNKYVINKKIGAMCADFVLCKKTDLSILGVVELEKFSKVSIPKQKERREKMLASVCKEMGLKLFYFDGRQDYSGMDIRRLITGRTRSSAVSRKVVAAEPSMVSVEESSMMQTANGAKNHSCPKCYSDVVTKIAVKGENIGEKFLMCRKYPYCDYQVSVKDAIVKEMQLKEDLSRSKAGYRNW